MRKKIVTYMLACLASALVLSPTGVGDTAFAADQTLSGDAQSSAAQIEAPTGKISSLRQTGATTSSVDISFDKPLDSTVQYEVRLGTAANAVTEAVLTTNSGLTQETATITGLSSGSTFYVQVVPYRVYTVVTETEDKNESSAADEVPGANDDDVIATDEESAFMNGASLSSEESTSVTSEVRIYGTASDVLEIVTTPSDKVTGITTSVSGTDSATVSWSTAAGASGYYVDYMMTESTSQEKRRLTTQALTVSLTGLSSSKSYTVSVTPYRISSSSGYIAYDDGESTSVKIDLTTSAAVLGTPSGTVTDLVQQKATSDSAEITFTLPQDKNASYSVQLSKNKESGFSEIATVSVGSYAFTELEAGSSYYVRIVPFYQNWNSINEEYDRTYGTASNAFEIVTVPESKPKAITQTAAITTGFTITWDAADGANGYTVDYYMSGSKTKLTAKTTETTIKLSSLKKNQEYNVYVTPYRKSESGFIAVNESNYTGKYNIPVKPQKAAAPTQIKFWQSLGKVNVKTTKISCADGYQYALYTAGSSAKKIKTIFASSASSADITSAKLKKNTLFKVKVRAYILVQGEKVYGAWSDFTYIGVSPKTTLAKKGSTIRASWDKVKYADRYVVYISKDKTSGYKKCFVTKKTSCVIQSYGKAALKSSSRYYVYVVPQVKVNGVYKNAAKRDKVAETD